MIDMDEKVKELEKLMTKIEEIVERLGFMSEAELQLVLEFTKELNPGSIEELFNSVME